MKPSRVFWRLIFATVAIAGCQRFEPPPVAQPEEAEPFVTGNDEDFSFAFDEEQGLIRLDPTTPAGRTRRFDIGQGSVTLETREVRDQTMTFWYTPEIEGGYTTYECVVPLSGTMITVKVNADGMPGETSFDLSKCRIIKEGNLHWE